MKRIAFILLVLALPISHLTAQTSSATALIVLDEIDASVSKHINSIDNLATNAIGNTGNMLLSLTSRLRKDINESLGNTDKLLRENQQNLYNQILNLSNEFKSAIEGQVNEIDVISTKITQAANDFLVRKKEPNIFKYETPPFILEHTSYYFIKIHGSSFDRSDSVALTINGQHFIPIQSNYSELVFRIDSSYIKPHLMNKYMSAVVTFHWHSGLFNRKRSKTETFIIPVIPLNIGKAFAFYEQELPERIYTGNVSYSCDCDTDPSSWTGSRRHETTAFNLNPSGGRKFDPDSVKVTGWTQRYGGAYSFDHKTEQQITGEISCYSDGKPRGGGGFSKLTFTYKEYDIIYKNHKNKTSEKEVTCINPTIFELPDPVDNKRPNLNYVKITTYDGKDIILTPSSLNAFFTLSINPVTDDVIIKWKD